MLIYVERIPVWKSAWTQVALLDSEREVYVKGTLTTSEPDFATQVPVTVHAVGSIGRASLNGAIFDNSTIVLVVCLTFTGAHNLFANGSVITNTPPQPYDGGICLDLTSKKPSESLSVEWGTYLTGRDSQVEWLNVGEAVPRIVIAYWGFVLDNGEVKRYIAYPDASQGFPIVSYSAIESTKTGNKFYVISTIAVIYALAEWALSRKKKRTPKKIN